MAAQPVIFVGDVNQEQTISSVFYIEDSLGKISADEIMSAQYENNFLSSSTNNVGFKETIDNYWLNFEIVNTSGHENEWLIDFDKWVYVSLYVKDKKGNVTEKVTGHLLPFSKRDYGSCNKNLISLKLKPDEMVTCYVKLQTTMAHVLRPSSLNFKIYHKEFYLGMRNRQDAIISLFSGVFMVIFLYNLFIFISTKDKNYLLYLAFVFFNFLVGFQNFGYNFEILKNVQWYPGIYSDTEIVFSTIYGFIILSFTNRFLKVKEHFPLWYKVFQVIKVSLIIILIPAFMGYDFIATNISGLIGLFTLLSVMIVAVKCYLKKFPSSGYFLLAQSAFIIGLMVYLIKEMMEIQMTDLTTYSAQIGASVEAVLFSFALANRINILEKDNKQKQQDIITQLRENELLQTKVNRELEEKVEERTAELKSTQAQLVQREKLAALGQLTAGVAHEIKNPLNFVTNFSEMSRHLIDELKSENNPDVKSEIINNIAFNLDKIRFHGKRADSIINNMLLHSRTSSGKKQPTDINAMCDECMKLSFASVNANSPDFNCKIETQYAQNIPVVDMVSQDVSRVIFNMLSNAFDAIKIKGGEGKINITTLLSGKSVLIKIKDNGCGIPEKIKAKIFQPFFTTKETQAGTGLGLSISFDIIKAQGGEIIVESAENLFTEFTIMLPLASA